MDATQILREQVIVLKRGRLNSLGFEPAFNSYFDFYISSKYINPPLIKLEDMGLHLYLRKNLNDKNPAWKMPTIRQMMEKLNVSQRKLEAMMGRLEQAHLLKKVSGYRKWGDGHNMRNEYILSDPLQTLEEFLVVASEDIFGAPLNPEWACTRDAYEQYAPGIQDLVRVARTDQQTLTTEQEVWDRVLEQLKPSMPSATFATFLQDTELLSLADGVAVIAADRPHTVDWLRNRLGSKIKRALECELRLLGTPQTVIELQFDFV